MIKTQANNITLKDVFGPDGLIAINKPGYELRNQQVYTARLVEQAITEEQNALIEAGTGVGKSFSLTVPAILSGRRTVISTETNTLLDQYVLKDLPFLASILPVEFTYAKAKGKNNYVCKKKVDDYLGQPLLSAFANADEVDRLVDWARQTESGDRSEPNFGFSEGSWQTIAADELCAKKKCPYYGEGTKGYTDCFACIARRAFLDADIVVTNHTLCLLNAAIGGDAVLGSHEICIFDEGHTLAEQSQKTFGFEIKQKTMSGFARYAIRLCKASDLPIGDYDLASLEYAESDFFDKFRNITKPQMAFDDIPVSIITEAKEFSLPVISELDILRKELNSLGTMTEDDEKLLEGLDDKIKGHIKSLKGVFEPEDNWLSFVEANGEFKEKRVTVHYKPIDVAPILIDKVFSQRKTTIMASATLSTAGRFDFYINDTGIPDPLCLCVGSSFDYVEQCTGYFPIHLPDPNHPEYHTAIAAEIEKILVHTNGRAFVLFTSYRDMNRVYELVSDMKYEIYKQGELPKPALIERFKEDIHSVLFATRSFFTGVDIPGEALSCVILVKAPFRPPDEPMFAAKCKLIRERGGNDFVSYALPLMVNDLRQAFGRLIRSKTDTGMFAFLDSRAIKKPYFKTIINSLPTMKVRTELT